MTRRLLLSYLSVTAFVLLVLEIPLGVNFARHERARVLSEIERDATVMASFAEDRLEARDSSGIGAIVDRYASQTGARLVVTDAGGIGIADSTGRPAGEDFSKRPEFAKALRGDVASGSRYSATLRADLLYVTVPVASGGRVHGVVRVSRVSTALDQRVRHNWLLLGFIAAAILAAVSLIGWSIARSMTQPVAVLETATAGLAEGRLEVRAPIGRGPPELVALARTFNDMAQRLQALIASQRDFVADASHELRTPLTALRLRLENLEDGVDPSADEDLEGALGEAHRLQRIVEGLLALARLDAGEPERMPVDVRAVLLERRDVWSPLAEQKDVRVVADVGADAMCAWALPGSVEQVVDNFIANALEVAPPGSVIDVRAARLRDQVEVHVIDRGLGLSKDEREHAFDRFWRKDDGQTPGSGLGLAIARRLARASGGDARLDAAPDGGVDAVLWLRAT